MSGVNCKLVKFYFCSRTGRQRIMSLNMLRVNLKEKLQDYVVIYRVIAIMAGFEEELYERDYFKNKLF